MTEQIRRRTRNRSRILRCIHFEGPIQRSDLSRRCHIRKTSVSSIIDELHRAGLVALSEPARTRSPVIINHDSAPVLAAALTTQALHVARVHLHGEVQARPPMPLPTQATPDKILKLISRTLRSAIRDQPAMALGLAIPGLVDPATGRGLHAANLPGWRDVAVGDRLGTDLGIPVYVDNEVRSQMWSVAWFDHLLREFSNILYVEIAAGVGGALMMHGQPLVGRLHGAGEFGHVRIEGDGRTCSCGCVDCLEAHCALPAMASEIEMLRPDLAPLDSAEALVRAAPDEAVVRNVLDRSMRKMASALSPIVATLDPEVLVLGTPVLELAQFLRPLLAKHLADFLGGLWHEEIPMRPVAADETALLRGIGGRVIARCFDQGVFDMQVP